MSKLEDRIHYALPLNHIDFNKIINVCVRYNTESIDRYKKSNDGLEIQVKCYKGNEIPCMGDLEVIQPEDPNWINEIPKDIIVK